MSKGDFITIYLRGSEPLRVEARQNGRRIDIEDGKTAVIASEVTRGGTIVRKVVVPKSELLAYETEMREDG